MTDIEPVEQDEPEDRPRSRISYGCEHDLFVGVPESVLWCAKCGRTWFEYHVVFGA